MDNEPKRGRFFGFRSGKPLKKVVSLVWMIFAVLLVFIGFSMDAPVEADGFDNVLFKASFVCIFLPGVLIPLLLSDFDFNKRIPLFDSGKAGLRFLGCIIVVVLFSVAFNVFNGMHSDDYKQRYEAYSVAQDVERAEQQAVRDAEKAEQERMANEPVEVPDVRGKMLDEARGILDGLGLKNTVEESDGTNAWVFVASNWRVDAQEPESGSSLKRGDEVMLVVTNVNKEADASANTENDTAEAAAQTNQEVPENMVAVPNVIGMDQSDASQTLKDINLRVENKRTNGEGVWVFVGSNWEVVGQEPAEGELAEKGSAVTLILDRWKKGSSSDGDSKINWISASAMIEKFEQGIHDKLDYVGPNRYGEYASEIIYSDGYSGLYCAYWSALEEIGKPGDKSAFENSKMRWQYDYTNEDYKNRLIDAYNSGGVQGFSDMFNDIFQNEVFPAYKAEFEGTL